MSFPPQRRQRTPLLLYRRKGARRRWTPRRTARALSGRDQRFAKGSLAQVHRSLRPAGPAPDPARPLCRPATAPASRRRFRGAGAPGGVLPASPSAVGRLLGFPAAVAAVEVG